MTLKDLKPGQLGVVASIGATGPMKCRMMDMGITPGVEMRLFKAAPLGDPVEVNVRGYELSLRREETQRIEMR